MIQSHMPRRAQPLANSPDIRTQLLSISTNDTTDSRLRERARIILNCLEGKEIQQVAHDLGLSIPTVSKWRAQFARLGLDGLRDAPRSGKPATYDRAFHSRVLALIEQPPPPGLPQWDAPSVAQTLGASIHAVWRALHREGLYLQRVRNWRVTIDSDFTRKVAEIAGLYLDPPLSVMLIRMAEPTRHLPPKSPGGFVETESHTLLRALENSYKRNSALNLDAALQIAAVPPATAPNQASRHQDFTHFLHRLLADSPPNAELHAVLTYGPTPRGLTAFEDRVRFHVATDKSHWLSQIEILLSLLQSAPAPLHSLRQTLASVVTADQTLDKAFRWRSRALTETNFRK